MFLLFLIHLVAVFLGSILQVILLCKTVQVHKPRIYIWLNIFIAISIWCINNYLLPETSAFLGLIMAIQYPVSTVLFAQKGQRLKAMVAISVYIGVQMIVVWLVGLVAFPVGEQLGYSAADLRSKEIAPLMSLICLFVYWPIVLYTQRLIKKLLDKQFSFLWQMIFLPIPISQIIILNILTNLMPKTEIMSGLNPELALVILLSLIADAAFFVGILKIKKNSRLEEQIHAAQEQLNVQTRYYDQLQENILAINQIRHDLSNQLQTAYHLLEQGEHSLARSQLDQLQSNIQKKVGPNFCANLVVDAVLSSKANLCQEQGILLDINANLPEELPIDSAHLCSAFSNLLDNSIQGVLSSKEKEKHIELRAALQSDCLVIRCSNPALPTVAKRHSGDILRPHGLGLDILRQIAAQYDGTLVSEYQNHCFDAVLILKYKNT